MRAPHGTGKAQSSVGDLSWSWELMEGGDAVQVAEAEILQPFSAVGAPMRLWQSRSEASWMGWCAGLPQTFCPSN